MKVQDSITEYLTWKKMNYPRAAQSYKSFLKQFDIFFSGQLESLTIYDINNFVNKFGERYAARSVRYMVAILKDFFKYYPNIINVHLLKSPRLVLPDIRYLKRGEFELIDESLSDTNEVEVTLKLIHHIFWSTGIRVGELCGIHLDNINMEEKSAKIITEKSLMVAYIMWGEKTHELLINYLGFRLQRGGDYLFDIPIRKVQRLIRQMSLNVGLIGVTPHKYRHGKAHEILRTGGTIDDVSFILRHTNPMMTKKMYLRLDKEENLSIMGKFV